MSTKSQGEMVLRTSPACKSDSNSKDSFPNCLRGWRCACRRKATTFLLYRNLISVTTIITYYSHLARKRKSLYTPKMNWKFISCMKLVFSVHFSCLKCHEIQIHPSRWTKGAIKKLKLQNVFLKKMFQIFSSGAELIWNESFENTHSHTFFFSYKTL